MKKDSPVIAIIDNRLVQAHFVKFKKNKVKIKTKNSYRFVAIDQVSTPGAPAKLNNYHGHLTFVFDQESPTTAGELYAKSQSHV